MDIFERFACKDALHPELIKRTGFTFFGVFLPGCLGDETRSKGRAILTGCDIEGKLPTVAQQYRKILGSKHGIKRYCRKHPGLMKADREGKYYALEVPFDGYIFMFRLNPTGDCNSEVYAYRTEMLESFVRETCNGSPLYDSDGNILFWNPDGHQIVLTSDTTGNFEIYATRYVDNEHFIVGGYCRNIHEFCASAAAGGKRISYKNF